MGDWLKKLTGGTSPGDASTNTLPGLSEIEMLKEQQAVQLQRYMERMLQAQRQQAPPMRPPTTPELLSRTLQEVTRMRARLDELTALLTAQLLTDENSGATQP